MLTSYIGHLCSRIIDKQSLSHDSTMTIHSIGVVMNQADRNERTKREFMTLSIRMARVQRSSSTMLFFLPTCHVQKVIKLGKDSGNNNTTPTNFQI